MDGQMSLYDCVSEKGPTVYKFKRYIGQWVKFNTGDIGKIVEIEPYYTIIKTESGDMCGTPSTIYPV